MPWTSTDYPNSLKNLRKEVRDKAIDIANTLVEDEHMEEGKAIAIATSRAKDWAVIHKKPIKKKNTASKDTDVKKDGYNYHVTPDKEGWTVKAEGKKRGTHFDKKAEAITAAKARARKAKSALTIQRKDGTIQDRISYNPNNPSV